MGRIIACLIGITLVVLVTFVSDQGVLRLTLWIVILLGFVGLRAGLAERMAHLFMARKMAAGCMRFEMLPQAPQDETLLARWEAPQQDLKAAGFTWVGDCRMQGAGFPHCIRLMQRSHQTFASLVHMVPSGEAASYCELFTAFTDGSTVTTSNSRFGSNFKRPSEYTLDVLPLDTCIPDLLTHHDGTVSGKAGRVRDVMTVASVEDLFALWQQVEEAVHEYRKKAGFLTEDAARRVQATGTLIPEAPPESTRVRPRASPPQVHLAATQERRMTFRDELAEALQEAYPELELVQKAPLILEGRYRDWHDTLDLEKPFADYLDDPVRKSFIIASFVSNLGTALGHGKGG